MLNLTQLHQQAKVSSFHKFDFATPEERAHWIHGYEQGYQAGYCEAMKDVRKERDAMPEKKPCSGA
jgi:hypothetical protein